MSTMVYCGACGAQLSPELQFCLPRVPGGVRRDSSWVKAALLGCIGAALFALVLVIGAKARLEPAVIGSVLLFAALTPLAYVLGPRVRGHTRRPETLQPPGEDGERSTEASHPPPRPGIRTEVAPTRREGQGERLLEALGGLVGLIISLVTAALVITGIVGFIWGGTNDAHARCLAHRFGDDSFLATAACAVEH
jgi:hypothetical protein